MKKTSRKLTIAKETVRSLAPSALERAAGALATYAWTVCLGPCAPPQPTGKCTIYPCFTESCFSCLC